jgi:hypothetical protein
MLERLRLADAGEGITEQSLYKVEHAERGLAVAVHPVPQIFQAFVLDYRPAPPRCSTGQMA